MDVLEKFYSNSEMRESVRAYLRTTLEALAVERAFAGQEVTGIKEANTAIENAFSGLEGMFFKAVTNRETDQSR